MFVGFIMPGKNKMEGLPAEGEFTCRRKLTQKCPLIATKSK